MASSAFPSVIAAIQTVATTALPLARVVRGRDVSNTPGDVVMIGVSNVDPVDWESAGRFQQTMQTYGGNRQEDGTVYGLVYTCDGGGDQTVALSNAFDLLAAIETAIRANEDLGLVPTFEYLVTEFQAGEVTESQDDRGANAVLSFAIDYRARI